MELQAVTRAWPVRRRPTNQIRARNALIVRGAEWDRRWIRTRHLCTEERAGVHPGAPYAREYPGRGKGVNIRKLRGALDHHQVRDILEAEHFAEKRGNWLNTMDLSMSVSCGENPLAGAMLSFGRVLAGAVTIDEDLELARER
jgi:hypothetical protein